jgi:hypothetical protein
MTIAIIRARYFIMRSFWDFYGVTAHHPATAKTTQRRVIRGIPRKSQVIEDEVPEKPSLNGAEAARSLSL